MSEKVKNYRELLIWQKGIELVKEIYEVSKMLPKGETYAFIDQLRRSAISIPSNIAEGQARQHTGEFRQFLFVALGSLAELDTQLVISNRLGYLRVGELDTLNARIEELRKMIRGLISKLTTDHRLLSTKRKLTTDHSPLTTNSGFSLIELLIAMVVASIVGMAGYVIFSSSNWSYKVQEDVSEVQQNVRVAMDRVAKDIRLAGFGLPDPPFSLTIAGQTFTSPITLTNSATGPDTITIVGIGFEAGTLLQGAETDCNTSGTAKICLDSVDSTNNFFGSAPSYTYNTDKEYISLNGAAFIQLSNTQSERTSAKLSLGSPSTLDRSYPDGTTVYIIQAVTYTINTALKGCSASNPCLARQDLAGNNEVFATGIEDIQFAYGIDASPRDGKIDYTGSYTDSTAFYFSPAGPTTLSDPSSIIAVKANIVGKTRNTDPKVSTGFSMQCKEDRSTDAACTGASDGYRRRALTKIIKIRNPRQGA